MDKSRINYTLKATVVNAQGKEVSAEVTYPVTSMFDTHGFLHLKTVHVNLIDKAIDQLTSLAKTA